MSHYILGSQVTAVADIQMNNATVKNLWNGFCLTESALALEAGASFTFRLGDVTLPKLPEGKEYILQVTQQGVAVVGKDYGGLMRGFISLLLKIEQEDHTLKIKAVTEESGYTIENRMIHICVFPENDLYFIKKLIRLCGICQYTHIVIEFWGMLQYACLKELAWPHAFTKTQAKELIRECRELGMEPIPMFNQLGHASASRLMHGKHVVLDQNPRLQHLFTPDGWAWDIRSEEVFTLLKQVRQELYDLFGEGSYMHIGCDEAYYITRTDSLRKQLPDYLARLTREVELEGRRPMLWMDMLLEEQKFENCYTVGKQGEVEILRAATAPSTVFIDWQYRRLEYPIPSLVSLKDCGRDTMGAPWYQKTNYEAHVQTIIDNQFFGIMHTTWHTLKDYMHTVLDCAKLCGARGFVWSVDFPKAETATMLRRLSFEGNTYADAGWAKEQVEV